MLFDEKCGQPGTYKLLSMIMMYILWRSVCLFVCPEKSSLPTSRLSAGGGKWAARWALLAVGRLWPSGDYGDVVLPGRSQPPLSWQVPVLQVVWSREINFTICIIWTHPCYLSEKRYIDDMTIEWLYVNQESTSLQNYTFFTVGRGGHPYKGCPQY